jgi:hypothetical protein
MRYGFEYKYITHFEAKKGFEEFQNKALRRIFAYGKNGTKETQRNFCNEDISGSYSSTITIWTIE